MSMLPPRELGRTGVRVPTVWRTTASLQAADAGNAALVVADDGAAPVDLSATTFLAIEIGPDELERRADQRLIDRLSKLSRSACDMVIVRDIASSDMKIGWPMHRLQQLRDRGLCKWFAVETHVPLEAEWIAANTPVHAIVAPYTPDDMAIRYRVFEVAHTAGVALLTRARTRDELAFQLSTPQITAVITDQDDRELKLLEGDVVENYWSAYAAANAEPAKLRSGHPPEYGA